MLSPGPRTWFDTTTPGASRALEDGIYRLDGTKLNPVSVVHEQQGRREDTRTPFLERSRRYDDADSENQWDLPTRVIDPAQVDHVTICGVEIPVSPGT